MMGQAFDDLEDKMWRDIDRMGHVYSFDQRIKTPDNKVWRALPDKTVNCRCVDYSKVEERIRGLYPDDPYMEYAEDPYMEYAKEHGISRAEAKKELFRAAYGGTVTGRWTTEDKLNLNKKEHPMNGKKMINMMHIENGAQICKIEIHEGRGSWTSNLWSYLYLGGNDLEEDDLVIADTKYGPCLGRIRKTNVSWTDITCDIGALRYIMSKADIGGWEAQVETDKKAERAMDRARFEKEIRDMREMIGVNISDGIAGALGYTTKVDNLFEDVDENELDPPIDK